MAFSSISVGTLTNYWLQTDEQLRIERAEQTQENWKSMIRTWNIDDVIDFFLDNKKPLLIIISMLRMLKINRFWNLSIGINNQSITQEFESKQ